MVYEFQQSCKAYMKRKKIHVIPHGMRSKSVEQKKRVIAILVRHFNALWLIKIFSSLTKLKITND